MKFFIVLCLAGAALLGACSNHQQPATAASDTPARADSGATRNAFFPVADYLEAEIRSVDSAPLAKKMFTVRNGHTDSVFLELPEFNQLAFQFVPRELADSEFEKNFTETSFEDKATRSITFTYSPIGANTELQRVDVLTVPGTRSMEVKSVYLEKLRKSGDSVILQKMFWRAQRNFSIATLVHVKGIQAGEDQIRVVWDDSPEEE
ncbi:MAG TPA: hypothetical protein VHE34_27505 [Puia sp.]|uniref:hypothetical protein n=1 Tax=Puia sp. TaxID=2045100 RepID=UPI002C0ECC84|nr:hypothetical protein [Puia sp.]HVU99011.1 hypothetical protein [Puia sp.]